MNDPSFLAGVILSAGLSERMGRFKPLLPLGADRTIERVVKLFQSAGIAQIVVVTGHRADEVRQAAVSLSVRCVENPSYRDGMFTSVLAGVRALPDRCRAFFVHPVDIPLVRGSTVKRLAAALDETPAAVLYPTFDGRRGHPTLIRSELIPLILAWPGNGGLRALLQRHEAQSRDLAVADEAVLLDLDTPDDYRRLLARLPFEGIPSDDECRVLIENIAALPPAIAAHGRAAALVAQRLTAALNAAGAGLDGRLVHTAALLHDIARTRKDHAEAGARLLEVHGFPRLAEIVAVHMDLEVPPGQPVDEAQVVFLADKLVSGDRPVTLQDRFARKMAKYGSDPVAAARIERRRENAFRVQDEVERVTGMDIEAVAGIARIAE